MSSSARRPRCCSGSCASTRSTRPATSARRSSTSAGYVRAAGFETELLADDRRAPQPGRRSLNGDGDGPTLGYLGHVDTVLADPSEWTHDPWSGDLADGFLWGRGALDMKSQVAAEAVAGATLARDGWRPAARHAEARVRRRRGDRRRRRRPLADRAAPRQGPLRHAAQRGRRRGVRVRRPPPLRRVLRREGDLPLQADAPRGRRARVAAEDRRQRAAEAGAGARAIARPAAGVRR